MELTLNKTKKLLKTAVEIRGEDFLYPDEWRSDNGTCLYSQPEDMTDPACIVGMVASLIVGPLAYHAEEVCAAEFLESQGIFPTRSALTLLESVQWRQDTAYRWGESLNLSLQGS